MNLRLREHTKRILLGFFTGLMGCLFAFMLLTKPAGASWVTWPTEFMIGLLQKTTATASKTYLEISSDYSVEFYGAIGNGITDDTTALQDALDAAIADGKTLVIPAGSYLITETLTAGNGTVSVDGLTVKSDGLGLAKIIWGGSGTDNMLELLGCSGTVLDGLYFDGSNITGTSGIYQTTGASTPSMYTTLRNCAVVQCPAGGYKVEQWSATCDFLVFDNCTLSYNGLYALKIVGGTREVSILGGSIVSNTKYGIHLVDGRFCLYDTTFAINAPAYATGTATFTQGSTTVSGSGTTWTSAMAGRRIRKGTATKWYTISSVTNSTTLVLTGNFLETTGSSAYQIIDDTASDIYVEGPIAAYEVYGATTESLKFLDGDWANDAGWSRLLQPNIISGLNQASHDDGGGISAVDVSIDYDCARPLMLFGCKFHGDVELGSRCTSVMSFGTDFFNWERSSDDPDPITGFTGTGATQVSLFGRTDNGTGDGAATGQLLLAGGEVLISPPSSWLSGIDIHAIERTIYKRVGFADAEPDTYYALRGWVYFNSTPGTDEPVGWICTASGDAGAETTKATFEPFGENLIGVTITDFAKTNILVAEDAADIRTAAGLGTIATQAADSVSISGGAISGITDLALADGGTGASTAAAARTNFSLGAASTWADTPTAKTQAVSPYSISATNDIGKHFTNTGATDVVILQLPAATVGQFYVASRVASYTFVVKPASGEYFSDHPANEYIDLASDNTTAIIKCLTTGKWHVITSGTIVWITP